MVYKCPQCGHTSEQAGNCPTCNVPIIEETEGTSSEPQEPEKTE